MLRALLVGLCLSLAGWFWHAHRNTPPLRILLVTPPPAANAGLDAYACRALTSALQDRLESHPDCAITPTTRMPSPTASPAPTGPWVAVIVEPRLVNGNLCFLQRWSQQEGAYRDTGWHQAYVTHDVPLRALEQAAQLLTFVKLPKASRPLLPENRQAFWTWVELEALRLRDPNEGSGVARSLALLDQDRTIPEHWLTYANFLYRAYMNHPEQAAPRAHLDIQFAYQQAMTLAPDLPRAAFLLAQVRTTLGAHHEALDDLRQQLQTRPNHPLLLSGVASSARCAGLLDLASQIQRRRDRMALTAYQPLVVDLGLLYTGEWPTLEARLSEQPGHLRQTIVLFYKGYLALLQGRKDQALEQFRRVQAEPTGYVNYVQLAKAFQLILENHPEEARDILRAFRQNRVGLKVMDGELTFRIAEATALAGDAMEAVDLSRRAFAQGFTCLPWYERSPLMASLQGYSSYRAVVLQVQDRQAVFQQRHPASQYPK